MEHDTYKIEISKTDYYGKQFGRASIPFEKLAQLELLQGKEGVKNYLYEMYTQVKEQQSYT